MPSTALNVNHKTYNFYFCIMPIANAYLIIQDLEQFFAFTEAVFGARLIKKKMRENGSIAHAEIIIGKSVIMATEPSDSTHYFPASMYVYVADCDKVFNKAVEMQAQIVMEPVSKPEDEERYGAVKDSNGNVWWITGKLL